MRNWGIVVAFVLMLFAGTGPANAGGATCSLASADGNFSGVASSTVNGVPGSSFAFVALRVGGEAAIFAFFNGPGPGLSFFKTGTVQITNVDVCLLGGTLIDAGTGVPTFILFKVLGNNVVLVSTPFDPFFGFTAVVTRD